MGNELRVFDWTLNGKIGGPPIQRMRKKIDDGGFETPYRLRKQVVEPVFGQIKQARGFRQFLLRASTKCGPSGSRSAPPITC
jgi:Transposase DDE domain